MSGPSSRAVYLGDNGTAYCVSIPDWQKNIADHAATIIQNISACTIEEDLPKGTRKRKRYVFITATGKEKSFTVLDPASTIYLAPIRHVVQVPLFNSAVTADNGVLRGRTGERTKGS